MVKTVFVDAFVCENIKFHSKNLCQGITNLKLLKMKKTENFPIMFTQAKFIHKAFRISLQQKQLLWGA